MHTAKIQVLELLSYTHTTGETLTGWTETAERMTWMVHVYTFKTVKINSEWSQNDKNMHSAIIKVIEHVSYRRITGDPLRGWKQTAERVT